MVYCVSLAAVAVQFSIIQQKTGLGPHLRKLSGISIWPLKVEKLTKNMIFCPLRQIYSESLPKEKVFAHNCEIIYTNTRAIFFHLNLKFVWTQMSPLVYFENFVKDFHQAFFQIL